MTNELFVLLSVLSVQYKKLIPGLAAAAVVVVILAVTILRVYVCVWVFSCA